MKPHFYFSRLVHVLAVLTWLVPAVFGQPETGSQPNTNSVTKTNASSPVIVGHLLRGGSNIPIAKVNKEFLEGLAREDAFNRVVNPLLQRITDGGEANNGFLEFLKDLNLRPKVFQATGGGSNDASLGVEFDYKKSVANKVINENSMNPV